MTGERDHLVERRAIVQRDLEELATQLAEGEVEAATAERLRATYHAELESLDTAIDGLGVVAAEPEPVAEVPDVAEPRSRSPRRMVAGSLLVIAALSVAIALAARDTGQESNQPLASSPGGLTVDPASISNEQLEAVIAANPNVNAMRMALADRYFEAEEYGAALNHYIYIADNQPTPAEDTKALARIGWMAYTTGLSEAAEEYITASLAIDPTNAEAILFRGFITMYGLGDVNAAIPQLEAALELTNLSANVVSQIEDALAEARSGGTP